MTTEQDVVIAPLISDIDRTRRIGWAPTRTDAITIGQREYMRRMKVRRQSVDRTKTWTDRKAVA